MKIIAADDERLALEFLVDAIRRVKPNAQLITFSRPSDVLTWTREHICDVAFLDIQMRSMTGLELARQLKEIQPKINIIFVTGYSDYAGEAIQLHASGYIEKPVTEEKIRRELDDLRHPVIEMDPTALLHVRCFGNFSVYDPTGEPIHFERAKSKECLAYLISRCGGSCSIREIAGVLFEDEPYDRKQANYIQKIISAMMKSLKSAGAGAAVQKSYNTLAVDPAVLDCDYYRFRNGEITAVNSYQGEFMSQYSWAEFVTGYIEQKTY